MRLSKARRACVTAMMKDTIFEATNSLLEEAGTGGLTMDRVAKKVGVATASLYNYFHDKNELLQFFYARLAEPCMLALEGIAGAASPASQKLENILRTAWQYAVKHKGFLTLLVGMGFEPDARNATRPRLLRIFTGIFEQGIREGAFRPHDPAATSRIFLVCFCELFDLQATGGTDGEVAGFAETLIDLVRTGLHTEKSPGFDEASPFSLNP